MCSQVKLFFSMLIKRNVKCYKPAPGTSLRQSQKLENYTVLALNKKSRTTVLICKTIKEHWFNMCNVITIKRCSSFNELLFQKSQESYVAKVFFLHTINFPSGKKRIWELEKRIMLKFPLHPSNFPNCTNEEG